jgi:hypothetical protein
MAWSVFELRAREEESVGVTAYRRIGMSVCQRRSAASTPIRRHAITDRAGISRKGAKVDLTQRRKKRDLTPRRQDAKVKRFLVPGEGPQSGTSNNFGRECALLIFY